MANASHHVGQDLPRVLIMGHSFVSRFEDFCARTGRYDMGLSQCQIAYEGIGGATVESIVHRAILADGSVVRRFRPHLVVIQCGGNDLCDPKLSPETVGFRLTNMVDLLLAHFAVERVVVCEVFSRLQPRYFSPSQYFSRRTIVNSYLSTVLETTDLTKFWLHKDRQLNQASAFCRDGVHLSDHGLERYFRSIRGAIFKAIVHC